MFNIYKAEKQDLREILELQYLSFESEAQMIGSRDIPALKQDYEGILSDYHNCEIYKLVDDDGTIIGSVRVIEIEDSIDIGKLMVHPDYRRKGLASMLLRHLESIYPAKRLELYTCTRSLCNIQLYESVGFKQFEVRKGEKLDFVYMEKC